MTMIALLPPSSSSDRPKRCATRGPTMRPMRVLPVAETSGTFGSSSMAEPTVSSGPITQLTSGAHSLPRTLAAMLVIAIAVSGVLSDGFQMQLSPQTSASIAFHAQTAIGKLNAVMTPTLPSGCHISRMWCWSRSLWIVRP